MWALAGQALADVCTPTHTPAHLQNIAGSAFISHTLSSALYWHHAPFEGEILTGILLITHPPLKGAFGAEITNTLTSGITYMSTYIFAIDNFIYGIGIYFQEGHIAFTRTCKRNLHKVKLTGL